MRSDAALKTPRALLMVQAHFRGNPTRRVETAQNLRTYGRVCILNFAL